MNTIVDGVELEEPPQPVSARGSAAAPASVPSVFKASRRVIFMRRRYPILYTLAIR
jgi:hypothetical protein